MEVEGIRKSCGRSIKASSLAAQQQALRNKSHPDKMEKSESEERVCAGSLIQHGDQMKQTPKSEESKISNRIKERREATGRGCWMFTKRNLQNEICMWACMHRGVHASSLMHLCTSVRASCTDSLSLPPTVSGPAGDTEGTAHPCAQLHLQSGLLREILSRW